MKMHFSMWDPRPPQSLLSFWMWAWATQPQTRSIETSGLAPGKVSWGVFRHNRSRSPVPDMDESSKKLHPRMREGDQPGEA